MANIRKFPSDDDGLFPLSRDERQRAFDMFLHSYVYARVGEEPWLRLGHQHHSKELMTLLSQLDERATSKVERRGRLRVIEGKRTG